ncbi:MAG: hypothetical protein ACW97P_03135, partial [Candidatus Hodarchaeales archaeon]
MSFFSNFITPAKEETMCVRRENLIPLSASILLIFTFTFLAGCKGKETAGVTIGLKKVPDIRERLAQYSPTIITFDKKLLNNGQKQVLEKLIEAAKHMDNIFWRQAFHDGVFMKDLLELSSNRADRNYLRFLD